MAILSTNPFTSYELTESEVLQGSILTQTQTQLLQTERTQVATQILNQTFNPADPTSVQNDAFLKGQLSVYNLLLDRTDEAALELQRLAKLGPQA